MSFPAAAVSVAVAGFWVSSAATSLTVSAFTRIASAGRMPIFSMALAATSLAGIGMSAGHWQWIAAWAVLGGAANGLGHPATNAIIARGLPGSRIGMGLGAKQAAIPAAGMIAGLSLPILEPLTGWRGAFMLAATIAGLFLMLLLIKLPQETAARERAAEASLTLELRRHFVVVALAAFFAATAANTLPVFAVVGANERGIATDSAGLLLGAGSILAGLTRIFLGIAADRGIGGGLGTMGLTLGAAVIGLLLMAVPGTLPYVLGFLLAVGIGWGWSGLSHLVVARAAKEATAAGTGIVQVGAFAGNAVGPLVVGTIMTGFGQQVAWLALAGIGLCAVLATIIAPATRPG
ncbi:MFS family permease [Arthrobacter sp. B1I2]|nr:MFS family permease [Arthrobacter sp. B1I2]